MHNHRLFWKRRKAFKNSWVHPIICRMEPKNGKK